MNPEISAMLEKARRSLESARLLREHGDHDFAASRAYYSMFYVTEALLLTLEKAFSSHSATIGAYGVEFAKTGRLDPKFHRWLMDAHELRTSGDYETVEIPPERSAEACYRAEEFLAAGRRFLEERDPE